MVAADTDSDVGTDHLQLLSIQSLSSEDNHCERQASRQKLSSLSKRPLGPPRDASKVLCGSTDRSLIWNFLDSSLCGIPGLYHDSGVPSLLPWLPPVSMSTFYIPLQMMCLNISNAKSAEFVSHTLMKTHEVALKLYC